MGLDEMSWTRHSDLIQYLGGACLCVFVFVVAIFCLLLCSEYLKGFQCPMFKSKNG